MLSENKLRDLTIGKMGDPLDQIIRYLYKTMITENRLADIMKEEPFRGNRQMISSMYEVSGGYIFDTRSFLSRRSPEILHGADSIPTIFSCFYSIVGDIPASQIKVPKIRFNKKSFHNMTYYVSKILNETEMKICNTFVHIILNNESYYFYGRENTSSNIDATSNNFLNLILLNSYAKEVHDSKQVNLPPFIQRDNITLPLDNIVEGNDLSTIKDKVDKNAGYVFSIIFDIFNTMISYRYKNSGLIIGYEDLELSDNNISASLFDGSCKCKVEDKEPVKLINNGYIGKKYKVTLVKGTDILLSCSIVVALKP